MEIVPKTLDECLTQVGDHALGVWMDQIAEGTAFHAVLSCEQAALISKLIGFAEKVNNEPLPLLTAKPHPESVLIDYVKKDLASDAFKIRYHASDTLLLYDLRRATSDEEQDNARKEWGYRFDRYINVTWPPKEKS